MGSFGPTILVVHHPRDDAPLRFVESIEHSVNLFLAQLIAKAQVYEPLQVSFGELLDRLVNPRNGCWRR